MGGENAVDESRMSEQRTDVARMGQVQNINSQRRQEDSEGHRREGAAFINTDRVKLEQIGADMVRGRRRARC